MHPNDIQFIHLANSGDHGKAKFRMTVKLIVKTIDGEYHEKIPLGDVKYRKDNGAVLKGTFLPKITEGVNLVANEDLNFSLLTDYGVATGKPDATIKPV